eukprot:TRINITY_DN66334_c0_g1_i1.p1 TRINITY_DN66334_c0_g1~~TRINITY_DN66334_c0_g1_i1.p1  ORF type:complete len:311 (-),score=46.41 TRINITY_DN66334_c0_g1_i1:50-982(-)
MTASILLDGTCLCIGACCCPGLVDKMATRSYHGQIAISNHASASPGGQRHFLSQPSVIREPGKASLTDWIEEMSAQNEARYRACLGTLLQMEMHETGIPSLTNIDGHWILKSDQLAMPTSLKSLSMDSSTCLAPVEDDAPAQSQSIDDLTQPMYIPMMGQFCGKACSVKNDLHWVVPPTESAVESETVSTAAGAEEVPFMCGMRGILEELKAFDASCIFVVRRTFRLGSGASEMLRNYFSLHGTVVKVSFPFSSNRGGTRNQCGPRGRQRNQFAFVVMSQAEEVAAILKHGGEHCILGMSIIVETFRRKR